MLLFLPDSRVTGTGNDDVFIVLKAQHGACVTCQDLYTLQRVAVPHLADTVYQHKHTEQKHSRLNQTLPKSLLCVHIYGSFSETVYHLG